MERMWITGYRSYELNVFRDNDPKITIIKTAIQRRLMEVLQQNEDELWLITGPQMGTEQWTIELGNDLQEDYPQLRLAMMFPFADFGKQWNESNQAKLAHRQQQVDFFADVSKHPYQSPQQLRNYQQFMLGHTDQALLLYDPEYAGKPQYDYQVIQKYCEDNDYQLNLIDFAELQDEATEWEERQRENGEL